jgi:hypothetical protein
MAASSSARSSKYGSRKLPCGEGISPHARLGRSARWTGAVAVSYVLVCCGRVEVKVAHQRRQTVGRLATATRVLSRPSIIPSVYIGMARMTSTTDGRRPEYRSHDNGGGRRVMVRSGPRWTVKQSVYKGHSLGAGDAHRAYGDGRKIIR